VTKPIRLITTSAKRAQVRSRPKKRPATARRSAIRYVYMFGDVKAAEKAAGSWDGVRSLLGGKGANLAEMTRLKLPVPPGFILSTEACRGYMKEGGLPKGLWEQVLEAVAKLEKLTGKRFGDPRRPLLVSCRSGAKFSMPGMMDTVLNIGLNEEVVQSLAQKSGDARFAYDSYRRLIQMYGTVVLDAPDEPFEELLHKYRKNRGVQNDADLPAEDLKALTSAFKQVVEKHAGRPFPETALEQLELACTAVFKSWKGKRAVDYRNAVGIPHDLGTAVNIQTMVFGNLGEGSGTGVATTRNVTTGENSLEGDFLLNAQGEDVVAGTRQTLPVGRMADLMPEAWKELCRIGRTLERHYREVQDVEFTIESGKLWMLQTRDAKRAARAAIRIAVDMAKSRMITREEAVRRVSADHVDYFLHPQFDPKSRQAAVDRGALLSSGLNVSPGAAMGQIAFDADTTEEWAKQKRKVIMVRPETKPDDVHGLLAAEGVVTSRGGRTSHAALVARQFGKPAVVGVTALELDLPNRRMTAPSGKVLKEGDWLSIDGTTGEVFEGQLETVVPDLDDPYLLELLGWADKIRTLGVWANADYPKDAERARKMGAEGIGLCRTEHMFFETNRIAIVQRMILARKAEDRQECLEKLLPMQRSDFEGIFRAMDGLPVTIRLIDPPLHEFLPSHDDLLREVTELKVRVRLSDGDIKALEKTLGQKQRLLDAVESLREQNPMLGLRGVRLGIHMPELVRMQVRAIFEAACICAKDGVKVKPKVMIPLAATGAELKVEREMLEAEARQVMGEQKRKIPYQFGTMIELPRAALVADQIAEHAEFFSFGTNDLTQTTYGISRDDAETSFLIEYLEKGILTENPFATVDVDGVGALMEIGVEKGRKIRPRLEVGICGEHGGDPKTIAFCHKIRLDYVSCSPFRVPIARLAAAHAALGNATDHR
jgi:pyruvate, orthophosphate dikinase